MENIKIGATHIESRDVGSANFQHDLHSSEWEIKLFKRFVSAEKITTFANSDHSGGIRCQTSAESGSTPVRLVPL
jgi:hypothetical protein